MNKAKLSTHVPFTWSYAEVWYHWLYMPVSPSALAVGGWPYSTSEGHKAI